METNLPGFFMFFANPYPPSVLADGEIVMQLIGIVDGSQIIANFIQIFKEKLMYGN